ncbi:PspC domain-containing protein [bacterium]|nr:PspC domain-containing protein [bacterium]
MDRYSTSPNPKRFYRSRDKVIGGVCAGLADRMGWDRTLTRVAAAVLFFSGVFSGALFLAYLVLWVITPMQPYRPANLTPDEEQFWRDVSDRPSATVGNVKYRFRDLDDRLASLEKTVTSDEWRLRRQFRDLEGS